MLRLTEKLNSEVEHHPLRQKQRLRTSVHRLVQYAMNTRLGSVAIDYDYGLPEVDMFGNIHEMEEQIKLFRIIEEYVCSIDKRILQAECRHSGKKAVTDVIVFDIHLSLIKGVSLRLKTRLLTDSTYEVELL